MTNFFDLAIGLGETGLAIGILVFLRIGAVMALMPLFGEQSVPVRVRLVITLAFSAIVAPAVAPGMNQMFLQTLGQPAIWAAEVIAGLALGIVLRLFVLALQMAGMIIAQSISLSQMFGVGVAEPQPAVGHLLIAAGLAFAAIMDIHIRAAEYLVYSYELIPAGQFLTPRLFSDWGVQRVAKSFALAVALAAPFAIVSLVYNLALGVINRAMPQLMVMLVGAPAIVLGGFFLLFLALPVLLTVWWGAFDGFLANPGVLFR